MAISRYKDNRDKEFEHENVISLKHFPPKLRKLAKYLLQMDKKVTIKQACEDINVNYGSVRSLISREKKKGNDFNKFIKDASKDLLNINRIGVYQALLQGAVEGSAAHIKLFAQITGDLEETPANAGITIKHLTIGVSQLGTRPADLSKEKGIIDITPEIPTNKRD